MDIKPAVIQGDLEPRMLHRGKYVLWEKPDGTLRIQYQRDDKPEGEEDYLEIPGGMIRLAKLLGEGKISPMAAFKAMRQENFHAV